MESCVEVCRTRDQGGYGMLMVQCMPLGWIFVDVLCISYGVEVIRSFPKAQCIVPQCCVDACFAFNLSDFVIV